MVEVNSGENVSLIETFRADVKEAYENSAYSADVRAFDNLFDELREPESPEDPLVETDEDRVRIELDDCQAFYDGMLMNLAEKGWIVVEIEMDLNYVDFERVA